MRGIEVVHVLPVLRARIAEWKRAGERIALVPTMGNLHAGHFSLIERARMQADRVVASVFVNPTQFGPDEDFARYPRTPDDDVRGLDAAGCDLVWAPDIATMYPAGVEAAVRMNVPAVGDDLEGVSRPGHFDGVATVVSRLFLQVQPDVAVFGRKDYQQLAVIRRLVDDLAFPVAIVAGETRREATGLAMSSRNQYLTAAEHEHAALLYRALQEVSTTVGRGGEVDAAVREATNALTAAGFKVDYVAVRRADLQPVAPTDRDLVVLVAARLGRTRLIDNLEFRRGP